MTFGRRVAAPGLELRDLELDAAHAAIAGRAPSRLWDDPPASGDYAFLSRYRVQPLPPSGRLLLVVEWPGAGIELTTHELTPAPIVEAAARS